MPIGEGAPKIKHKAPRRQKAKARTSRAKAVTKEELYGGRGCRGEEEDGRKEGSKPGRGVIRSGVF